MSSVPREIYELFDKYGKLLASQPYAAGPEARLILDTEQGVFGTKKNVKFDRLKWSDIVKMADGHMSTYKTGMVARVVSQTPYCQQCLREGVAFRAMLDDMAQIVGVEAAIVDAANPNKKKVARDMAKAASNSAGFFVKDRIVDGQPGGYTLTVGRSLYEAVNAVLVMEKAAEIALKTRVIGGTKPLSKLAAKGKRSDYLTGYSAAEAQARELEMQKAPEAEEEIEIEELKDYELEFYGLEAEAAEETAEETAVTAAPEAENESSADEEPAEATAEAAPSWDEKEGQIRQALVDYGLKLQATGLVQGTWGNLSIRLDEQYMLVTPSGMDYSRLTAADMVKVDLKTMTYDGPLKPTSEKDLHAAIYRQRGDVGAVVHTHSRYCSMFAAANRDLTIETAEGQQVFGKSVTCAKYGNAGSMKLAKNAAAALGANKGAIMANHGMLTCGEDMEAAFKNCQLLESCAEAYIESRWK